MKQCPGQIQMTFGEIYEQISKDISTPLRVLCLYSREDILHIRSLKNHIDDNKVKFVTIDRHTENIFKTIDFLLVLLQYISGIILIFLSIFVY